MTRVLAARLDSVGDVLLAGPAVRAIATGRRADGGATNDVVLLCGPQGDSAGSLLPGVSEVYSWAARGSSTPPRRSPPGPWTGWSRSSAIPGSPRR